jgi:hypothetical protein
MFKALEDDLDEPANHSAAMMTRKKLNPGDLGQSISVKMFR